MVVRIAAAVGIVALAVVAVPAAASAGGPTTTEPSAPRQHQAGIVNFDFQLPTETVTAGDSIVFTNNAVDRPHTVTDRGGTFDTGEIAPGTTAEITLDVPGRYEFFCNINPSTMNGVVVVEPSPSSDATRVQLYDAFREGETRRIDPAELSVDLGTELVVANVGGEQHTLTAADGTFDTGTIQPGDEQGRFAGHNAEVTLDKVGTFAVFCQFFPDEMRGTITVVDEEATTTTTEASTTTSSEVTTTTAADDRSPPGTESAEAIPPSSDDRGIGGGLAAAGVVALGLGAVLVALLPKGPAAKPSEPELEEF